MTDDPERARLAERVLAEQEERRRLGELLHDGPVQHLSAIAQIVDAALAALRSGERERTDELLSRGLELARDASRELRALCDDLEPQALSELGFTTAVEALVRRLAVRHDVEIGLEIEHAEELGEHAQTALYQIVREAIDQAVRRGAPTRIDVSIRETTGGDTAGGDTTGGDTALGDEDARVGVSSLSVVNISARLAFRGLSAPRRPASCLS